MERSELLQLLNGSGQEHLIEHYDTLTLEERSILRRQILHSGLDFRHLNTVLRESLAALDDDGGNLAERKAQKDVEPPPRESIFTLDAVRSTNPGEISRLESLGLAAIARGETAVLLLSGGSGTRLGISTPKGLFSCELLRERKSLFQFHCEKVRRVQELSSMVATSSASPTNECEEIEKGKSGATEGPLIQVLIMVSEENSEETQRFFLANNWFGLKEEQVVFFAQSMLPCYEEASGKILMASPYQMCLSPGGNGGVYQSLLRPPLRRGDGGSHAHLPPRANDRAVSEESVLDRLRRVGVRYVQIFSVDNLLAKIADPLFYGYALDTSAHVVVKTTVKTHPEERVGVFAKVEKAWGVIEYTELGAARAVERDPLSGDLRFRCANIACHACSVAFLAHAAARAASSVFYHAARKRIPTMDGPVMGVKLEAFIFDMFRHSRDCVHGDREEDGFRILQVDREDEFAPIKNAEGSPAAADTPTTAARLLLRLHTRWAAALLARADRPALGSRTPRDRENALAMLRGEKRSVEISPLVSYQGEGLAPYAEFLIERLICGSEDIVLIDSSINIEHGAAKI